MSMKEENTVLMAAGYEELDYEENDANNPVKKPALALENEKDLEEGEILDEEDRPKRNKCYFFQRGKCRLGDKCAGLHVTDSLYKMIDSPPAISPGFENVYLDKNPAGFFPTFQSASSTANLQANTSSLDDKQCEPALSDWDRALIEAKKLVKQFEKTTNRTCPPDTVESNDERRSDKSTKKSRRDQSPSPKMLSRDCSFSDDVKKLPKQKLVDGKSDWHDANKWHGDRALIEAKKLIKQFNKITNRTCPPDTVESNDERRSDKSTKKPRRYQSPSPKMLSRDCSFSDDVKKLPKQKLVDGKSDRPYANKYHDPWRRSPVHPTKRFPNSANSVRNSRSPQRRKPDYKSTFEKRGMCRRSLSSSSSSPIHQSRKESSKPIQQKKVSPTKITKLKLSISKRELPEISKKRYKRNFHRSASSSSPRSEYHSRVSKGKTKLLPSKQEKKVSPAVLDRNSKSNERGKAKFPSSSFTSNCRSNDVGQWTPKKVRPPSPTVKISSDMSISPLSDSSLSDIFDPNKKETKEWDYGYEVSRSRSLQWRKKYQAEVYGPNFPPKNQIVASSIPETKSKVIQNNKFEIPKLSGTTNFVSNSPACSTKNKIVDVAKCKQVKNRKFSRNLEADLFRLHREQILTDDAQESTKQSKPILSNDLQQKSNETRVNKTLKKDDQSQKFPEIQNNQMKRKISFIQRHPISRKEQILQQLEAINIAIERKKASILGK